ncbi:DUF3237 domain-containing protein [Arthrobacter sp. Sa2BUA2]|uniref:UPF0311 protein H9638_12720 n=1 Tax=Arthrobacter pullicola TaxID=2762224 RepID=A0ABR8YK98_9MICC|nr:DUF3237 domain-containing protein [Arthrobacter pullicola]MBD8044672.1 DUF3237 domain-containing protein [Arthrobacter pullicola]
MSFSVPSLTFLATISVRVGEPIEIGSTSAGVRRIIPILGGKVEGPELRGTVLPAGADYQLLRTATLTELEAKYAIETDGGERLYVNNFGLRSGSEADIAALLRGEPVDPARIYFRCAPRIEAPAGGAWAWLSSRILIGTGIRLPDEVRLEISVVE